MVIRETDSHWGNVAGWPGSPKGPLSLVAMNSVWTELARLCASLLQHSPARSRLRAGEELDETSKCNEARNEQGSPGLYQLSIACNKPSLYSAG